MIVVNFVNKILSDLDVHALEVIKKSTASIFVKVAGILFALIVSVSLGRLLGAEGLGIINLSNRIVNILIVVGLLGFQQVIVKEIAIAKNRNNWQHIGNTIYTSILINGLITLTLSVIGIIFSEQISIYFFDEPLLAFPLVIAFLLLTPQVLSRIYSSALVGYGKIWQSNLVDQSLSMGITAGLILVLWLMNIEITLVRAVILFAIGKAIVTITMTLYWKRIYLYQFKRHNISKQLLKTALPLFYVTISTILINSSDVIVLGWLADVEQVGLYTVAVQIAMLPRIFLMVVNSSISPKIAALFESNQLEQLEKMLQQITKLLIFLSGFPLLIFVLFGKYILGLWGDEFINAYIVLLILSLGQFVNFTAGPTSIIMMMCGLEKLFSKISMIFLIINIILNLVLILNFGMIGAAIAAAFTLINRSIFQIIFLRQKLGLSIFPNFKFK